MNATALKTFMPSHFSSFFFLLKADVSFSPGFLEITVLAFSPIIIGQEVKNRLHLMHCRRNKPCYLTFSLNSVVETRLRSTRKGSKRHSRFFSFSSRLDDVGLSRAAIYLWTKEEKGGSSHALLKKAHGGINNIMGHCRAR